VLPISPPSSRWGVRESKTASAPRCGRSADGRPKFTSGQNLPSWDASKALGHATNIIAQRYDLAPPLSVPHGRRFFLDGSMTAHLLRRVQTALKPASKTLGLHWVFIHGKGLKWAMADSAFKRVQVDARAF
jgi:hypothetical protein